MKKPFKKTAILGRVGIQKYLIGDKWSSVLREDAEVRASIVGGELPITLNHPKELLDGKDSELIVGYGKNIKYNDGVLSAELFIDDENAIEQLKTHKYISLGYRANLVPETGTWIDTVGIHGHINEEYPYEYVQRGIKLDHIALVDKPRAGAIARINDGLGDVFIDSTQSPLEFQDESIIDDVDSNKKIIQTDINIRNKMKQFLFKDGILNIEGENAQEVFAVLDSQKNEIKALTDSIESIKSEKDGLSGELEGLKTKLSELEVANKELKDSLEAKPSFDETEIQNRLGTWAIVLPEFIKDNADFTPDYSLSVSGIKKKYLETVVSEEIKETLKDGSEAFIDGLWVALQPREKSQTTDPLKAVLDNSDAVVPQVKKINRNRPLGGLK